MPSEILLSPPLPVCSQSFIMSATPKSSAASGSWSVVASLHPGTTLDRPTSKSHPLPAPNRTLCPRTRPSVALVPSATPLPAPTRLNVHRAYLPLEAPLPPPNYQPARVYSIYPSEAHATQVLTPLQEGVTSASEAEPPHLSSLVRPSPKGSAALKSGDHTTALCPEAAANASNLRGVVLQSTLHSEAWDAVLLLWRSLVDIIGPYSSVLQQQLQGSPNGPALTLKLLQLNADTTALRYVKACLTYFEFLIDLGHSLDNLSQLAAVEAVYALHCSRSQDDDFSLDREQIALVFPLNTLKALRWLVKTVTLHFPDLYSGLFRALSAQPSSDRSEAMPLPLDFVAFLESVVLDPLSAPELALFAGSALVCIWSSLRFGDASHVSWSALLFDPQALVIRGLAYRTKTSRRGMAFAFYAEGIYGPWGIRWLQLLAALWGSLEQLSSNVVPDSLFFCSSLLDDTCDFAFCPASYASALRCLRSALNMWGRLGYDASRNFTLHSCKATVLSWCSQLGLGDMARREQGHHRTTSVTLYGRDDTHAALALQASILGKIRTGAFRPSISQHRGAQSPMAEPQLLVREGLATSGLDVPRRFRGGFSEHSADPLTAAALPLIPSQSTSASSETMSQAAFAPLGKSPDLHPGIFLASAKTVHRVVDCDVAVSQACWQGRAPKTACGAVVRNEWTILFELEAQDASGARRALCKRPSCFGSGLCL